MNNIRWNVSNSRNEAFGYVSGNNRNKYFIGAWGEHDIVADVRKSAVFWHNINVPCSTLEEAMRWCEMIEATGAY